MPQIWTLLICSIFVLHRIAAINNTNILIEEIVKYGQRSKLLSRDDFFYELLERNRVIVDKSLLIKELVEDAGKIYVITCPQHWGKSVNLDMLRSFFRIQTSNFLIVNSRSLFVKGAMKEYRIRLKSPFLIANEKGIIDKHQGQYPVIHINMNSHGTNFKHWKLHMKSTISSAFRQYLHTIKVYEEALELPNIDDDTKANLRTLHQKFMKYSMGRFSNEPGPMIESLCVLSETLFRYYGKKVIILIDEYANPWLHIFQKGDEFKLNDKEIALNFYTSFLEATLNNNTYIEKAILTDVLPPSEELQQKAFPDAIHCNLLTGKFMEYYGINQWEMRKLFDYHNISNTFEGSIEQFFKGYEVGNKDLEIYNPGAIMDCLKTNSITQYWIRKTTYGHLIDNFLKVPSFKKKWQLVRLPEGAPVELENRYFTWADYEYLIRAMSNVMEVEDAYTDKALMMLYNIGYLTTTKIAEAKNNCYYMKLPNQQISIHVPSADF